MRYLVSSPAVDRVGWILDGLSGAAGWGRDAADVLAPEFAALVSPDAFKSGCGSARLPSHPAS